MAEWIPVAVTGLVGIASIVGMAWTAHLNREAQSAEAERGRKHEREQEHRARRRAVYVDYLRSVDVMNKHLTDIARAVEGGEPPETLDKLIETARKDGLLPLIIAQKTLVLEAPGHVSNVASAMLPRQMMGKAKAGEYVQVPTEKINEALEAMRTDLGIPAWGTQAE